MNVVNLRFLQHYGLMVSAPSERGQHRSSYHHGNLPSALTDAATQMAREGGPDAVVLRAVARATGVSAAAAYRHFADHGELLHAVRYRALEALADAMRASLDSDEPLDDPAQESIRRLRALGRAYITFALTDPGLFRTAFCRLDRSASDLPARLAEHGPFAIVSGVLDELVERGVLDPSGGPVPRSRPGQPYTAWRCCC